MNIDQLDPTKLYTTGEVAKFLGVAQWQVSNIYRDKRLPLPLRRGVRWMLTVDQVQAVAEFLSKEDIYDTGFELVEVTENYLLDVVRIMWKKKAAVLDMRVRKPSAEKTIKAIEVDLVRVAPSKEPQKMRFFVLFGPEERSVAKVETESYPLLGVYLLVRRGLYTQFRLFSKTGEVLRSNKYPITHPNHLNNLSRAPGTLCTHEAITVMYEGDVGHMVCETCGEKISKEDLDKYTITRTRNDRPVPPTAIPTAEPTGETEKQQELEFSEEDFS